MQPFNYICDPLEYYAEHSGNSLPTFRDNLSVTSSSVIKSKKDFLTLEVGTHRLSRNLSNEVALHAAQISSTLRLKD